MYATPSGADGNGLPVAFADIIARNHRVFVQVTAETPAGAQIAKAFTTLAGQVQVDRSAAVRRQLDLDVAPLSRDGATGVISSVIPTTAADALSPYGTLLRVSYGIDLPGVVSPFYWNLGLFRVSAADVQDDSDLSLKVKGYDLSRTISRNKLTKPWIVAAGTNYGDAIIALATDRYAFLKARDHGVASTFPAAVVLDPEQDPWAAITDWATAAGCDVYFDVDGYLAITPAPNPETDPVVWTYQDAGDGRNATLLGVGRSLSDDPGENGVILTTDSPNIVPPIRAEVWDLNPSSPTYSLGPYGKVPKFVSNPYVGTQEQADAAAAVELRRITGGTEQVSISVLPNPAHEAGDILRVIRPRSGVNQTTVLESFSISLGVDSPMSLNFRERRATA